MSAQTTARPANVIPLSEWPPTSRRPPKKNVAPSEIAKALAPVSEPSAVRRERSAGRSSRRKVSATKSTAIAAAAITGPPNPR